MGGRLKKLKARGAYVVATGCVSYAPPHGVYVPSFSDKGLVTSLRHWGGQSVNTASSIFTRDWDLAGNWDDWNSGFKVDDIPVKKLHCFFANSQTGLYLVLA